MISLTFKDINDQEFHKAVSKLVTCARFSPKQAYHIHRIADKIYQGTKEAREGYQKLIKKYAKMDEKGGVLHQNTPPFFVFSEGANKDQFEIELKEFMAIDFTIDKNKLKLSELPDDARLSAQDMSVLDPLIEFETPVKIVPKS